MSKQFDATEIQAFLSESNRIEGIHRDVYDHEFSAALRFLTLDAVTLQDLNDVQQAFAPGHALRDRVGLNVRVGRYVAPAGGPEIRERLQRLLADVHNSTDTFMLVDGMSLTPFAAHVAFEMLHPYTDGNGRTGRILWAWHMRGLGRDPFAPPFLHRFYYQTLEAQP